jgi:adenylate cyclase
MAAANDGVEEGRRIELRIGINLGDVIGEGSDIYGEGVNIAARLEPLAETGGIVVSDKVEAEVRGKVRAGLEDLGERQLKNIDRSVRVYRVSLDRPAPLSPAESVQARPSIAVLPFDNMSGGAEQQYLSDGITADIITELSRFRSLFVIARNSSFQYRDKAIDVRRVARELGVQFLVGGSIRCAGERLRITAQLIDAKTGDHVWAERYDRDMEDVFAVQDEMARTIAATLAGRVVASAAEKVKRKPTRDWKAYDYLLRGRERDAQYDIASAVSFYSRAIELDPGYGHAHAYLALALVVMNWYIRDPESLRRAQAHAQLALSIDAHDAASHQAAGYVAMHQGKFDQAGIHFERAVSLNPNDVLIAADHAGWLTRTGRPEEAIERLDAAMRRDPFPATWIWEIRFLALFHLKRYDEAIAALGNMSNFHDGHYADLAAAYAHAGSLAEARAAVANLRERLPGASIARVAAAEPYSKREFLDHRLEGLRKAGLPE